MSKVLVSRREYLKTKLPKLDWIWKPLIPKNHVTLLSGPGGIGKSSFALYLAHKFITEDKVVLYIDAEQCGDEINNKCETWDLPRIDELFLTHSEEDSDNSCQTATPKTDAELNEIISSCKPDIVIIDSLTSYCSEHDMTTRQKASKILGEIKLTASNNKTTIIVLCHTNKENPNAIEGVDMVSGSKAITDLARSVLLIKQINDHQRYICQYKVNSALKSQPLYYDMTNEGITNVAFGEEYEIRLLKTELNYESGVKAEKYRAKALSLIIKNTPKSDIIKELKAIDATSTECTRAYQDALKKHYNGRNET